MREYSKLAWEDRIRLSLGAVYENYGFKRYRMGRFEPYDMYLRHKDFLTSANVITFTDAAGRLMALKPDVTMSIVKNIQKDEVSQKLYYMENVFRIAPGTLEYGEISQIGIESIGSADTYSQAEVLILAGRTLAEIGAEYVLGVSHMRFLAELLASCGFTQDESAAALELITQKNASGLTQLAASRGVGEEYARLLRLSASLSDEVPPAVAAFSQFTLTGAMKSALGEIERVCSLVPGDMARRLRLDFTAQGSANYYNGIVFKGYIEGLPRAVLAGGRYDNLLRRFGKPQSALGFALYLGELSRAFTVGGEYDADVLLVYGQAEPEEVFKKMRKLHAEGKTVRAERSAPPGFRAREIITINGAEVYGNA